MGYRFTPHGGIRKRATREGEVRYQAYINVADPERDGRRRQVVKTFARKADASVWLNQQIMALREEPQKARRKSKSPARAFLVHWIETVAPQHVRPSTMRSYRQMMNHVLERFGDKTLASITGADVQDFYADLLQRGKSSRTVRYIGQLLRAVLDDAEQQGIVSRNVARMIKMPALRTQAMQPLTREQVRQFLAAADQDRLKMLWYLYVFTGMRRGEGLALQWTDVDWAHGVLVIRRSVYERRMVTLPKTVSSERSIALSDEILAMLHDCEIQDQPYQEQARTDAAWMFHTDSGTPHLPRNINKYFKQLLKKAGLPTGIRLHDLRHTHATMLLSQGIPVKVVSERLGHKDINLTLKVYGHVMPHMQDEAARSFAKHLQDEESDTEEAIDNAQDVNGGIEDEMGEEDEANDAGDEDE